MNLILKDMLWIHNYLLQLNKFRYKLSLPSFVVSHLYSVFNDFGNQLFSIKTRDIFIS